jgi:hypothetical protein
MAGMVLPYWKSYAADTLSDSRFQSWDLAERGAFYTLLNVQWREGAIPGDMTALAKLLHVDSGAMRSLWSAIGDRFIPHPDHPGKLANPRMEEEREEALAMVNQKKRAGKLGAESRWSGLRKQRSTAMAAPSEDDATGVADDGDQIKGEQASNSMNGAEEDLPGLPSRPVSPLVAFLRETYPDVRDPWACEQAWRKAYPRIDLLAEAHAARAWEVSNPKNAKRDHARFLNGWFGRVKPPPVRPRNTGDLGAEIIPWPSRLTDEEKRRARAELAALHPDLADAPIGIPGVPGVHPVEKIAELNARWRAIAEARA